MKKLIALSLAACVIASSASAQTERSTVKKDKTERHSGRHRKGEMMKELNLSKEQKAQLKTQHQEMKAKREALKAQDNITVKEMREKQKALKEDQRKNMESILTPEQKVKFEQMRKDKEAKMKTHRMENKGKGDLK
jgi:Spy/CpxP family protein refolding chaperone